MFRPLETILHEIHESLVMALAAIRTNRLRSILTLLGITVGVFSIIAVMTAMGVLVNSIENGLSQLGANYTVQYKDSVDSSDWSDLETVVGTGDVVTVTDATGKDARFYRVVSHR